MSLNDSVFRFLILICSSLPSVSAGPIDRAEKVVLKNGLTVVLIPIPGSPVTSITAVVGAGVRNETSESNGASHFLEHLLFNGTTTRTQKQLYDETDLHGIYNNASTRADLTLFMMLVGKEHVDKALNIQGDMLYRSTIPSDKFEKERKIVLEEIARDAHRPANVAGEFHRSHAMKGTPYAREVLGSAESLGRIKREDVVAYYRRMYVPSNTKLMVMGDFDREDLLAKIAKEYQRKDSGMRAELPTIKLKLNGRILVKKEEKGFKRTYLHVTYHGPKPGDKDFAAASALSAVLDGRMKSRFQKPSAGIFSIDFSTDFNRDIGTLRMFVELSKEARVEKVTSEILGALEQPESFRVSQAELKNLLNELAASELFLSEKVHYYTFGKSGALAAGSLDFLRGFVPSLEALSPRQVRNAGRKYLINAPFVATAIGPGLGNATVADLPRDETAKPLEGEAPLAKEARVIEDTSDGLTVIVKHQPGSSVFAAHVLAQNRCTAEPGGLDGIADFMHRLLIRGTRYRSAERIQKDLSAISAELKVTDSRFIPFDNYYFSEAYSYIR
ncbi:MAG: insulinase family protein, partial [Planctomycetota bacterium]|nr:insulinase family protein [Planctomycetota bacterium]